MFGKDYPSAYADGFADFYYERYKVTEGVLIPRPDTELLVEAALMLCGALKSPMGDVMKLTPSVLSKEIFMADLCCGTGCVGISVSNALVRAGREVECLMYDVSDDAVKCASSNLKVAMGKVSVIKKDILKKDIEVPKKLNLITSNPPYITDDEMDELPVSVTYEPELALSGGKDGLVFYDRLCKIGISNLDTGGVLVVEHGYLQQEAVIGIFEKNGYSGVTGLKDYGGNDRVVAGIWRG